MAWKPWAWKGVATMQAWAGAGGESDRGVDVVSGRGLVDNGRVQFA
jgi:hypothetical protein